MRPGMDAATAHSLMIKKKVDLVLVPVTVTDPMSRLVTGLDKENFRISGTSPAKTLRSPSV